MMKTDIKVTVKHEEYRKLFKMYTQLESLVEYNELTSNGKDFQFMIDDIVSRAKETLKEYHDLRPEMQYVKKENIKF